MDQPLKILVVDDSRSFRRALRIILNNSDQVMIVGEATNGEEALTLTGSLQPDVILLDMDMPRMNGLQATIKINQLYPAVKIIMLSGHSGKDKVLDALRKGAQGYLVKGIAGAEEILQAIQLVVKGQAVLSPHMAGWLLDEMTITHNSERL